MAVSKVLSEALSFVPQGYLFGLTMSTAGASTTLSVAAGSACDSTGLRIMKLVSSIAKTTSAWAVGTGNGGIDTGAVAINTWYHFFLIQRVDTGVVDVLFSLSATAPTMPANYTLFRRIGAMKTNGSSQWTSFTQAGDEFLWTTPVQDVTLTTGSVTAALKTLTVPTGVNVLAKFQAYASNSTSSCHFTFYAPDMGTQSIPGTGTSHLFTNTSGNGAGDFAFRTNTSSQIGVVADSTGGSYTVLTYGWIDTRGKLS